MKDALSTQILDECATEIKQHYAETVQYVARKQIEVGLILLKARKEFKGDKEFGQWRAECTPIGSRQTAHKLMQLAEQHGNGRIKDATIDALPTSTLFEMLSAPDSVVEYVDAKVEEGEHVTAKEIREEKKAQAEEPKSKAEELNQKEREAQANREAQSKEPPPLLESQYNEILQEPLHSRIAWARKHMHMKDEHAWVVFGIPPFAEGMPHPDIINVVYDGLLPELKQDQVGIFEKAYKRLQGVYA